MTTNSQSNLSLVVTSHSTYPPPILPPRKITMLIFESRNNSQGNAAGLSLVREEASNPNQ